MPLVDKPNAELARKVREGQQHVNLYDPPVDGATPLNGADEPRTSPIPVRDVEAKLAQGFTREPLPAPPVEEPIVAPPKRARKR